MATETVDCSATTMGGHTGSKIWPQNPTFISRKVGESKLEINVLTILRSRLLSLAIPPKLHLNFTLAGGHLHLWAKLHFLVCMNIFQPAEKKYRPPPPQKKQMARPIPMQAEHDNERLTPWCRHCRSGWRQWNSRLCISSKSFQVRFSFRVR